VTNGPDRDRRCATTERIAAIEKAQALRRHFRQHDQVSASAEALVAVGDVDAGCRRPDVPWIARRSLSR
jgi:hypothetical protein